MYNKFLIILAIVIFWNIIVRLVYYLKMRRVKKQYDEIMEKSKKIRKIFNIDTII
tara:strand:+ start:896 stop:1060 length:165 start_codon:yes stop_codon:yes gene_type:complete